MTHRRDFIKSSAIIAAAAMVSPITAFTPAKKTIGLQLYTVRDLIQKDLKSTLEKVAKIGYTSLEAAGYNVSDGKFYGMVLKAFVKLIGDLGMKLNSSHTTFGPEGADKVIGDAAEAGVKYIVYPFLAEKFRTNLDGWKATADKFNKLGEIAKR